MGGGQVIGQSLQLVDGPGNGASSVTVWYTPSEAGQIVWTATILDNDPDVDEATATSSVSN